MEDTETGTMASTAGKVLKDNLQYKNSFNKS